MAYCMLRRPLVKLATIRYSRSLSTIGASKISEPLRVLFCGSDEFSSTSLRALHAEQQRNPAAIESIDVLYRPGKQSGRGLKNIREVPIKAVALELGLAVHERDTFTGWNLPTPSNKPLNIVIAVSFGLFVPPRILNSVKYGGLNVHPSLLPQFRGAAPLEHTIMSGYKRAGVTLQTLDKESFDHGIILAQTSFEDTIIPNYDTCTYSDLLSLVTPKAAEILIRGIQKKLYVPPHIHVGKIQVDGKQQLAPKITSADREVLWNSMLPIFISRRYRALGRLWNNVCVDSETASRLILEDAERVPLPEALLTRRVDELKVTSLEGLDPKDKEQPKIMVWCGPDNIRRSVLYILDGDAVIFKGQNDSHGIRVEKMTLGGKLPRPAVAVMASLWNITGREGPP